MKVSWEDLNNCQIIWKSKEKLKEQEKDKFENKKTLKLKFHCQITTSFQTSLLFRQSNNLLGLKQQKIPKRDWTKLMCKYIILQKLELEITDL